MLSETLRQSGRGDLHVFAYGSLAWRPGFPFKKQWPAAIRGYARRLCIRSFHYRGTPEKPGLVLWTGRRRVVRRRRVSSGRRG